MLRTSSMLISCQYRGLYRLPEPTIFFKLDLKFKSVSRQVVVWIVWIIMVFGVGSDKRTVWSTVSEV